MLCGDRDVTPSAPKLRQVFALLAVHANRVVRTDQLIEELWEDRPPLSATTTLQTYVYQLRKLLSWISRHGYGPDVVLSTSPGGYMLALPDDALDAHRFEQLAEQGRQTLSTGDYETAATMLHAAQELWRGRPMTAVDAGPVLHVQAVRLEELHKVVVEQRIDADLRLGRHLSVIGELRTLVSQQPTHEGFQAKLMLALYRARRRLEALTVFQQARTVLSDELGLEPSTDLQDLHRAILAASDTLDAPAEPAPVRPGPPQEPPSQLPADLPRLYGQRAQLSRISETLTGADRSAPRLAFVVGPPASGKSVFAVHAGHRVRAHFPDGQLCAALTDPDGGPADLGRVVAGFLTAIGMPPARIPAATDERIQMFRTWTANRRVLVVLDDVTDVHQLVALQPSGPGCGTIATGRQRMADASISCTATLDRLTAADATDLLTEALGAQRLAVEPGALAELINRCDGLPGALRSVAGALQLRPHWSIWKYLTLADHEPRRFEAVAGRILELSLERTSRVMAKVSWDAFRTLARHVDGPISPLEAALILNCDEIAAESILEDLVVFQLAEIEDIADGAGTCRFRYQLRGPLRAATRLFWPPAPVLPAPVRPVPVAVEATTGAPEFFLHAL